MKTLIVANWKCNPTALAEAKKLFNSVKKGIRNIKKAEIVICPPFIYLPNLLKQYQRLVCGTKVRFGAQDCFWKEKGAFTSEISPLMLKDLGVNYVIVGHSERRKYQKETDEMISKKIKAALGAKLKPILCLGETEEERKKGKTFEVLKNQLKENLKEIGNWKLSFVTTKRSERRKRSFLRTLKIENLIVAYEPVWAIGTGNPCHSEEAEKVLLFLRKFLKKSRILYGGSVNSQNAVDYIKKAGFQGLLVGSASLNSKEFIDIIKAVC